MAAPENAALVQIWDVWSPRAGVGKSGGWVCLVCILRNKSQNFEEKWERPESNPVFQA